VPPAITVTIMVFSSLRERLGTDRCAIEIPAATPVDGIWPYLPDAIRSATPPAGVRYAVNDTWATPHTPICDADRVAIILPVSGG
jgi:molybdopterin converting factor small subunit